MTLGDWIVETTPYEVSKLMRVDLTTVSAWKRAFCLPRPEQMMRIVTLSRGRVSYAVMVETVAASLPRAKAKRKAKKLRKQKELAALNSK